MAVLILARGASRSTACRRGGRLAGEGGGGGVIAGVALLTRSAAGLFAVEAERLFSPPWPGAVPC